MGVTLWLDTEPRAERVLIGILRSMPAWRKLQLVDDANRATEMLALAGLKSRHPDADDVELRRRWLALLLGDELAEQVYGPLPGVAR